MVGCKKTAPTENSTDMDSRLIFFAVAFFLVLIGIRLLRHYAALWFKDRPIWAIVASSAMLGLLLLFVLTRFDTTSLLSCLQGNTLSACWSPTTSLQSTPH
ncbi:hypothetical protein C2L65_35270 [Paraburkholderia terrae]|uniref:Uncharacterized protein n=1 Tax=Paraburkholderia terrae TaxID=311230 RepID=A0A2I8F1H4_9BURK|nr:hypothetical protein C2L65_35270 [Paraburkholderia terrae]